jgi:hypothetical protein
MPRNEAPKLEGAEYSMGYAVAIALTAVGSFVLHSAR